MKIYRATILTLITLFAFGCSQTPQTKSPTEVLRALNEASETKDVPTIKNSVSRGTLSLIEESAKAQNTTTDEFLRKDNGAPFKELPEMRNEKIEGDSATVELKNTNSDDWETVPFVKEDGVWRLALDKYVEDFKKKETENMKMPPPAGFDSNHDESQPDTDSKPKAAANKTAKNKK